MYRLWFAAEGDMRLAGGDARAIVRGWKHLVRAGLNAPSWRFFDMQRQLVEANGWDVYPMKGQEPPEREGLRPRR